MTHLLFIHGILGKPDYFDFLREAIPAGYQVTDILLEGHGHGPKEFAAASMARWRSQVAGVIDRLRCDGNKVVICAHSMGALFAIEAAVSGKADALFLLNTPLALRVTRRLLTTPLNVKRGKIDDQWSRAARDAYSITDNSNLLHYLGWVPRYLELFAEIHRVRRITRRLTVPTRVYLSARDEMVSPSSARPFRGLPAAVVRMLPDSGHYFYAGADCVTIVGDFANFLRRQSEVVAD